MRRRILTELAPQIQQLLPEAPFGWAYDGDKILYSVGRLGAGPIELRRGDEEGPETEGQRVDEEGHGPAPTRPRPVAAPRARAAFTASAPTRPTHPGACLGPCARGDAACALRSWVQEDAEKAASKKKREVIVSLKEVGQLNLGGLRLPRSRSPHGRPNPASGTSPRSRPRLTAVFPPRPPAALTRARRSGCGR